MPRNLPDRIAPWHLAQSGQQVRGQLPLARMPRLAPVLLNQQGEAKVELVFGCDMGGRSYVHGHIKARLQLICQRCLQPLDWPLDIQVRLALMMAEAGIKEWPDGYESWVVAWEEMASLWSLMEDELLLALPIAARHRVDECPAGSSPKQAIKENKEREERISENRSNPFFVLEKLKH